MSVYIDVLTYFHAHISIQVYILLFPYTPCTCFHTSAPMCALYMFSHFNALTPLYVYKILHSHNYTGLYTSIPIYLYMFTYTYVYVNIKIILRSYTYAYLHRSTAIYINVLTYSTPICLYIFTYFCYNIHPAYVYILLRPNTYNWSHTSTHMYVLYMITYFYAHSHLRIYIFYAHIPINVFLHIRPYVYLCLHTFTSIYASIHNSTPMHVLSAHTSTLIYRYKVTCYYGHNEFMFSYICAHASAHAYALHRT
jgi:hypothetical protein